MPDHQPSTEDRIRFLEAHVEIQEEMLASIQAERIEAERLNESVTRLGMGASDLGAALLQVDKTQQLLTKLGQDISRVENESATSEEVERKVAEAKAEAEQQMQEAKAEAARKVAAAKKEVLAHRKKMAGRFYTTGVGALAGLAVISLAAVNYVESERREDRAQCERSLRTTTAVVEYLEVVRGNSQVPAIRESAEQVISALPPTNIDPKVACER